MSRNYAHVLARIFNTPHFIAPEKAGIIVAALSARLGVAVHAENGVDLRKYPDGRIPGERSAPSNPYALTDQGIAVLSIDGTLVHCAATAAPPSGMTTYGDIEQHLEHALRDPSVRGILLDIDSPGGEGSESVFAVADRIREARAIKPIWAVADECATSAAYLIGSAASRLYVPANGRVGSIGACTLHLDESGKDKQEGLVWTYIFAGAHKVDGNTHEPLPDAVKARYQARIDAAYERFLAAVGAGRPSLGAEGARHTEAQIYMGDEAVKLGLADGIADFRTVLAEFTAFIAKPRASSLTPRAPLAPVSAAAPASAGKADDAQPEAVAAAAQPPQEKTMTTPSGAAPTTETSAAALTAHLAKLTAADLRTHCAAAVAQISTEAATAERGRILGIEQQALPGHEALIAKMKADGTTTPEQAAVAVLQAEKQKGAAVLQNIKGDQPSQAPAAAAAAAGAGAAPVVSTAADADTDETTLKANWEKDAALRAEFTSFETYAAVVKAEANGQVKRLRSAKAK